ncbi:MAG TPA: class F sortase [Pseudonocardiaceae bacterium]|jgi:sortase (surface protein transpeptidase)|nr:class F sortase [Pseudonocardiaceae bacterium]
MLSTGTARDRPGRSIRWVVGVLLAGVCLAGCGGGTSASAPAPAASTSAATSTQQSAGAARSVPTWIDIPSIDARSSLIGLGLNPDKSVQVPPVDKPQQAGWYEYGPTPGQVGPAVILGHIDGDHQEGIFWRLHEVKPGDAVTVGRQDGSTVTFTVSKVDQVPKDTFPTSAVYGNTTDPELRLITCSGAFDATTGHYLDNVIVYATKTN